MSLKSLLTETEDVINLIKFNEVFIRLVKVESSYGYVKSILLVQEFSNLIDLFL
jgi:hypothetical protein